MPIYSSLVFAAEVPIRVRELGHPMTERRALESIETSIRHAMQNAPLDGALKWNNKDFYRLSVSSVTAMDAGGDGEAAVPFVLVRAPNASGYLNEKEREAWTETLRAALSRAFNAPTVDFTTAGQDSIARDGLHVPSYQVAMAAEDLPKRQVWMDEALRFHEVMDAVFSDPSFTAQRETLALKAVAAETPTRSPSKAPTAR